MQKLTLTSEEKKELEKRGFVVKNIFHLSDLFQSTYPYFGVLLCLYLFNIYDYSSFWNINITTFLTIGIIPIFLFIMTLSSRIFLGKIFYSRGGIISYGEKFTNPELIKKYTFWLETMNIWMNKKEKYTYYLGKKSQHGFSPFFKKLIIYGSIFAGVIFNYLYFGFLGIFFWSILYSLPFFIFYIIGICFNKIHPLYSFGNLGEKIQKLTPTIESKRKEIQENFEKDMNFRILSEGFDSLSSIFSEIVRLVIKLEQVEKKANKGNLFDSEKYINSLRGDIVEPIKGLKSFLEGQREKLRVSQKELQKVQVKVGGSDELTSEGQLSSKRGESLMLELDENISKLEEMIEKMS